jgi:hypothetical protein
MECVLIAFYWLRTEMTCGLLVNAIPDCYVYISEVQAIIGINIKIRFSFRGYELYIT